MCLWDGVGRGEGRGLKRDYTKQEGNERGWKGGLE